MIKEWGNCMLISARMLEIVKHLSQYQQTTYKEIEQALNIKERNVRYDIERINEILIENQLSPIMKGGKGILKIPEDFSIKVFEVNNEYIYSHDERLSIILIYLLFCSQQFNLSQLSKDLLVSRSTIKNDFDEIETYLLEQGLTITYDECFQLNGDNKKRIALMVNELKKYILLIKDSHHLNSYQKYLLDIFKLSFPEILLKEIIMLIDDMLEMMDLTLRDEAYNWYVAHVICMIWFFENKEIPVFDFAFVETDRNIIDQFIEDIEHLVNKPINEKNKNKMVNYLNYLNRFLDYEEHVDMIKVESIVTRVIKRIELLKNITNENEIAYLVIHFVASLKRIHHNERKRILLVCGHGYGTTTMLKESLLSEYQVEIVDTIPKYKLSTYQNLDQVDKIITTTKLDLDIDYLQVNPILTKLDDRCLINAGIARKSPLSNYYSINKSLDFLKDEDRTRVLEVIRRELGYRDLGKPKKIGQLADLLNEDVIQIIDQDMTWEEAVIQSCHILEESYAVNRNYLETIFDIIEQNGFYFIVDGKFALLHGNCEVGVYKTAMSMIINQKKVKFGDKEIQVIFCLSSKDQKEHIPAIINLMKLEKTTDFMKYIVKSQTSQEAYEVLMDYERRFI